MSNIPPLDSMKFPASVLLNSPQSDIFPGMIKIAYNNTQTPLKTDSQGKTPLIQKENTLDTKKNMLLPMGIATITGLAIGRGTAKMIERPIDNLPAGLIGAAVCGAAVVGTTGFYIAQYGGFFDKDRDFKTMFKNL
jgi:hypothetical protein